MGVLGGVLDFDDSVGGFIDDITGKTAADAAEEAAAIQAAGGAAAIVEQREAAERAQGFFEPFSGAAQRGVDESGFLANPQAQFESLQENPLFNLALENANQSTLQQASAGRRLSFGDTLQQLSNNVLLSASPLIDRQREDVTNLLQFGGDVATSQANIETGKAARIGDITTSVSAAQAAGTVGAANAQAQGAQNLVNTGVTAAFLLSDERLKTNKRYIGTYRGYKIWSWEWNWIARALFGMTGCSFGVMAQEVFIKNPSAVIKQGAFYRVNYGIL